MDGSEGFALLREMARNGRVTISTIRGTVMVAWTLPNEKKHVATAATLEEAIDEVILQQGTREN